MLCTCMSVLCFVLICPTKQKNLLDWAGLLKSTAYHYTNTSDAWDKINGTISNSVISYLHLGSAIEVAILIGLATTPW